MSILPTAASASSPGTLQCTFINGTVTPVVTAQYLESNIGMDPTTATNALNNLAAAFTHIPLTWNVSCGTTGSIGPGAYPVANPTGTVSASAPSFLCDMNTTTSGIQPYFSFNEQFLSNLGVPQQYWQKIFTFVKPFQQEIPAAAGVSCSLQ